MPRGSENEKTGRLEDMKPRRQEEKRRERRED